MSESEKKCTIIYPAKNDNYNKFFLNRLNYVIEHTCDLINQLELNNFFELNIVDWGSKNKISEKLIISPQNKDLISFYEVSEEIALKETKKKYGFFSQPKVINVALRRIKSDYLIFTSHDLIFSKLSLLNLYNYLNYKIINKNLVDNAFVNIQRYFLPADLMFRTPSFKYLNDWLTKYSNLNGDIAVTTGSAFAAHLASRKIWETLKGVDERFEGYGFMDPDLHSRANMLVPYYNSSRFAFHMYKIHRGYNNNRSNLLKFMNKNWTSLNFNTNLNDWGAGKYEINKSYPHKFLIYNETKSKLGDFKIKKFPKKNYFSIFLVPIILRIYFIRYIDVKKLFFLNNIIKNNDLRNFIFLGYSSPLIPLFLLKFMQTSNVIIYDNLKKIVFENKKLEKLNNENLLHSLNFERVSKLGEAKSINLSQSINHQGYFRNINALDDKQLLNVFDQLYLEKANNFFVIYESHIYNFKLLSEEILKNLDSISAVLLIKNTNEFKLADIFVKNNYSIEHLSKDVVILSLKNIKIKNNYEVVLDFFIINKILIISNLIRFVRSVIRRLFNAFKFKNFKNLGG